MKNFKRFAVYYAPKPGALTDFAASWLGWDAVTGQAVTHPNICGLPLPVEDITATPRKYGFHGTLKPPFRLAEGSTPDSLVAELNALAARLTPVEMTGLALSRIGRFLALVPEGDTNDLSALAAQTVRALDMHRAPASAAELAKRRANGLTDQQEALLTQWGYPYVMDEFRFHLTLSGRLAQADAEQVLTSLTPVLAPILPRPFQINDLCLFGEDGVGRFHLISRHALTG